MMPVFQRAVRGIECDGFSFLPSAMVAQWLGPAAAAAWSDFAASWEILGEDRFMADGGRYRRRRHAALEIKREAIIRKPHQPHYQSRDYNPLNGGIQRWFDPVLDTTLANPAMQAVLIGCGQVVRELAGEKDWHVEVHQFRIEAAPGVAASPTPEGLHRDGVDWVYVMLVQRENVDQGVTRIADAAGGDLGRFTLTEPMDSVFLDDRRVHHGVTAIAPIDPAKLAYRDALVVTFADPTIKVDSVEASA